MFTKIIYKLSNVVENDQIEHKLIKIVSFLTAFIMFIAIIFNYFVHQNNLINIYGLISFVQSFIVYLISLFYFRYSLQLKLLLFSHLIIIIYSWAMFEGINGIVYYVIVLTILFFSLILRDKSSHLLLFSSLALVMIFSALEYNFPFIVLHYKDENSRFSDVIFIILTTIIIIFSLMRFVFSRYLNLLIELKEKEEIQKKNQIIKDQNKKLYNINRQLELSNIAKDKFFSIVSHDIKNPIFAINLTLDMLNSNFDKFETSQLKREIEKAALSAENAQNLTLNLLKWSQSNFEQISQEKSYFSINDIIDDNLKYLNSNIEIKNIFLNNFLDKKFIFFGDKEQISLIFRNIISNAIKFSHKDTQIDIKYSLDNFLKIEIIDQGLGIDEEQLSDIFTISKHISKPGTIGEVGTGLGLILCKEFANSNECNILIQSKVGIGTKVTILFPKELINVEESLF